MQGLNKIGLTRVTAQRISFFKIYARDTYKGRIEDFLEGGGPRFLGKQEFYKRNLL